MTVQLDQLNHLLPLIILVVSLNIVMGSGGQPSIAHPALAAVGGYGFAELSMHQGFPFLACLVLAVAFGVVAAAVLGAAAMRLTGEFVILLTLAALYIVQALVSSIQGLGGTNGLIGAANPELFGLQIATPGRFAIASAVFALLVVVTCVRIDHAAIGRVLRAIRENEIAALSLGKDAYKFKVTAFTVTGGMAAVGGALLAAYVGVVTPAQFTPAIAIQLFAMIIVGGSGNIIGSAVGAVVLFAIEPLLRDGLGMDPTYSSTVEQVIYGALLVLFILLRPQGILPERVARPRTRGDLGAMQQPSQGSLPVSNSGLLGPLVVRQRVSGLLQSPGEMGISAPDVAVTVRELRKSFGGVQAVAGVDLDLPTGTITSLVGPNGAGKTTLFSLLTGYISPDGGDVRLNGRAINGLPPDRVAREGMVRSFQDVKIFTALSAFDNVRIAVPGQSGERLFRLFASPAGVRRTDQQAQDIALQSLEFVGLTHMADRMAAELSYAEQKLLAIARSLATGASVLLLDEPTSGVDPGALSDVAARIRELPAKGCTVCVVEHNLHFLRLLGGDCYFLQAGRVTDKGKLDELMNNASLREAYFGV